MRAPNSRALVPKWSNFLGFPGVLKIHGAVVCRARRTIPKRGATLARTVLIVDDSPIVRRTVSSALLSDGFAVCGEANNGQEAIELAGKLSPDLIILDVSMPVMNGLQAAPVLRRLVPKSPIILYTLYADKAVEQELATIKVDSVLSKREPVPRQNDDRL